MKPRLSFTRERRIPHGGTVRTTTLVSENGRLLAEHVVLAVEPELELQDEKGRNWPGLNSAQPRGKVR